MGESAPALPGYKCDVIDRLLPAYLSAVKCFRVGLCAAQLNWLFFLPTSEYKVSRASKFQDAHIPDEDGCPVIRPSYSQHHSK